MFIYCISNMSPDLIAGTASNRMRSAAYTEHGISGQLSGLKGAECVCCMFVLIASSPPIEIFSCVARIVHLRFISTLKPLLPKVALRGSHAVSR